MLAIKPNSKKEVYLGILVAVISQEKQENIQVAQAL